MIEEELPDRFFFEQRHPRRIGDLIADLLEETGLSHRFAHSEIRDCWVDILGEAANHTRITGFKRNVLYIQVDSAPWLHELSSFRKAAILSQLQQKVAKSFIEDIKFRLGNF